MKEEIEILTRLLINSAQRLRRLYELEASEEILHGAIKLQMRQLKDLQRVTGSEGGKDNGIRQVRELRAMTEERGKVMRLLSEEEVTFQSFLAAGRFRNLQREMGRKLSPSEAFIQGALWGRAYTLDEYDMRNPEVERFLKDRLKEGEEDNE